MAYGGGIFLPSETAYKDPNRFKDILQAEGNKEAAYLSSMDQFYEQLTEMKREFDITSAQRERFFEEDLAFKREGREFEAEQSALDRSLRRWEVGETTSASRFAASEAAGATRYVADRRYNLEGQAQDETRSQNQFFRGLYSSRERRTQEAFDIGKSRIGGGGSSSSPFNESYAGDFSGSYYSPFSGESISDFFNS